MAGRPRRHRRWLLLAVALVAAVAAALLVWRPAPVRELADRATAGRLAAPAEARGPVVPEAGVPSPVAEPVTPEQAGTVRAAAVRRALAPGLADPDLGSHVVALVGGLDDAPAVYAAGRSPLVPASTTKLLTATAALEELGPDHVFTTRVVAAPRTDRIVLVGGGDPYLSAGSAEDDAPPGADLATLARRTAAALTAQGIRAVRLGYDATLFSGPTAAPSWEADYLPDDVVSPITALWVDEGRAPDGFHRVADPPAYAAAVFARALTRQGVAVRGSPVPTKAPGAAPTLASVESAPLAEAVERVLEVSDNEGAEVLAHHVGLATGHPGSFAGGVAGVEQALGGLGVPLEGARLFDGSGLSRANRLEPATLLGVLRVAAADDRPELRSVLTGLPVAGFTGSLAERFTSDALPGRGLVRAKTGTLTGVSGLAGLATGRDGTTMVFVLVADRIDPVDTLDARAALDGLAAALARCRCGG